MTQISSSINLLNIRVETKQGHFILDDINCDLPNKGLIVVGGPNGAGKSTLLRVLAGLNAHYQGIVLVGGRDLRGLSPADRSKRLSWLPAQEFLPFNYSCRELLLLGRYNHHQGYPTSQDRIVVKDALEKFQCQHLSDRGFLELSSGEQRLIQLARIYCATAEYMILDEPLSHLDARNAYKVMSILKELSRNQLIVISCHDLHLTQKFADFFMCIEDGKLREYGSTLKILTPEWIQRFLTARSNDK